MGPILADVMMPGMGGLELLQEVRKHPAVRELPVLLLSARADDESRLEGLGFGSDDYLVKPFSARELLARVAVHLELARMRRESRRLLSENSELFELVSKATRDLIWDWDLTTNSMKRTSGSNAFGYSGEALAGGLDWWLDCIHPSDRGSVWNALRSALDSGRDVWMAEYRFRCGGGSYSSILDRGYISRDAEGRPRRVIGSMQDISELKRIERELTAALKEKDFLLRSNEELRQLTFAATHDLKEPLRTIHGYTQLLARRLNETADPELREFMSFIVGGASRMGSLIDGLLNYGRILNSAAPLAPVSAEEALTIALRDLHQLIQESNAKIASGPLPEVIADATQLSVVFQNLIANAIKYRSERDPEIHISATPRNGFHCFTVADNGIGVPQEFASLIFGIFKRLDTDRQNGTGIGLAVCKKIVARHGGSIWVEPNETGGSRFAFTIPVAAGQQR